MEKHFTFIRRALDRASDRSLHQQLYDRIREAVLDQRLRPGGRLPSTRTLASELCVARGTVDSVYARLISEGYLISQGQRGTVVTTEMRRPTATARSKQKKPTGTSDEQICLPWLPLQLGLPAMDLLPRSTWTRIVNQQIRHMPAAACGQPNPLGLPALRSEIAGYLAVARGIACSAEQIIITHGYQDALNLTVDLVLSRGDSVWVEEPGYGFTHRTLRARGMSLVPVPVDVNGLRVEWGQRKAPKAPLAVVTPAHQFPLGVTLSASRRWELLNWASQSRSWVLEDDYDCEFHYVGRRPASLKSADLDDRVIYVGSFSKTLFPALRLGYLVVPERLLPAALEQHPLRYRGVAILEQWVVAQFMRQGHFARHLRRMRNEYRRRSNALVGALQTQFGHEMELSPSDGGLHIIANLNRTANDADMARRALIVNLKAVPLSGQYLRLQSRRGLLLSFTNIPAEQAPEIASALFRATHAG